MLDFIARRLVAIIPVLTVVAVLVFLMLRLTPGDPAAVIAGDNATSDQIADIRAKLGLNEPIWTQFAIWIGDVLQGNFGESFFFKKTVAELIGQRIEPTLALATCTLIIAVLVAVPLGVLAAWRHGSLLDRVVMGFSVLGFSVPVFVIGYVLIQIFAIDLRWLPGPVGRLPIGIALPPKVTGFLLIDTLLAGRPYLWWLAVKQLALPALTLGFSCAAPIARVTRSAMAEALQSDYVRTAIAMGHGRRAVWFRYSLRNALLPVITILGLQVGYTLTTAQPPDFLLTVDSRGLRDQSAANRLPGAEVIAFQPTALQNDSSIPLAGTAGLGVRRFDSQGSKGGRRPSVRAPGAETRAGPGTTNRLATAQLIVALEEAVSVRGAAPARTRRRNCRGREMQLSPASGAADEDALAHPPRLASTTSKLSANMKYSAK